jgi:methylglyoxal synthase
MLEDWDKLKKESEERLSQTEEELLRLASLNNPWFATNDYTKEQLIQAHNEKNLQRIANEQIKKLLDK